MKMGYVCRDMEGNQRWQANTEIRNKQGNVYIMTEKGEGVYSSFKGPISWVAEMEFESTDKNVMPLKLVKRVFDEDGNMIRLEKQDYDPVKKSVTCLHEDIPKKISRTKKFKFTKDAVNRQLLGLYAQKMLEKGERIAKIQMVSEEPGFYNMDLSVVGAEDVQINGRKRRAYKLQLDPRLGLLDTVKIFFPKSYAWHSAEPKFEWLRYEGLEGDIRSAQVEVTTED
ncbi:hypothetical protein ACFL5Y_00440 [Candidatus Omnitrophota bacterium]